MSGRILDFGCGRGFRAEILSSFGEYWGVDVSRDNIEQAKKDFPRNNFVVTDGLTLPFSDGYFDEIHAYEVMEHVADLAVTLKEIKRCLKNGGKLIVESPYAKSEELLLKLHSNYWQEVSHVRFVDDRLVTGIFGELGFKLAKKRKKKGIDNLLFVYYFKTGRRILCDAGDVLGENIWLRKSTHLFSEDFFQTKLFRKLILFWLVFPVWLVTLPIGKVISMIFPKTIRYEFVVSK